MVSQTQLKQSITSRTLDDPFKPALMTKDISITRELAEENGLSMPVSETGNSLYEKADKFAGEGAIVSELFRWVENVTGVIIEA